MIQDIYPHKLNNSYKPEEQPTKDSLIVYFSNEGQILVKASPETDGSSRKAYPRLSEFIREPSKLTYIFSMDDDKFFLASDENLEIPEGYHFMKIRAFRREGDVSKKGVFEAFTAKHLADWYACNKFCGKCGSLTNHSEIERAVVCPQCGNTVYPKICPAVIVGVIKRGATKDEDQMLLTKYNRGIDYYALVAGFTEIGETFEETVEREVMEETGIHVKNIQYYKSQPWGVAYDLLAGFICEADGDTTIVRDESELAVAEWLTRDKVILQPDQFSLTNEIMTKFKNGEI